MFNLIKKIKHYFSREPREPRIIEDDGYRRWCVTDGFFGRKWREMYILYECFKYYPKDLVIHVAAIYEDAIEEYSKGPIDTWEYGYVISKIYYLNGGAAPLEQRCAKFLVMAGLIYDRLSADFLAASKGMSYRDQTKLFRETYCLDRLSSAANAADFIFR